MYANADEHLIFYQRHCPYLHNIVALLCTTPLVFPIQHLWTPVSNIIGYLYPDPLDTPTQSLWIPLSNDFGDFRSYDKMTSKPLRIESFEPEVQSRFKFSILARFKILGLLENLDFLARIARMTRILGID